MAPGYWVARIDVTDPKQYARYVAANAEAFAKYGARFLVRAGRFEVMEGEARGRNVVIGFADYDTALACYRSPEYQRAFEIRRNASKGDLIVVEGVDDGVRANAEKAPPPGYWIARVDVTDADRYARYVEANAEAFARYGARFVVRAGRFEVMEGEARNRNVVIAFADYDTALACYRSREYQRALAIRRPASTADVVIIEGYTS